MTDAPNDAQTQQSIAQRALGAASQQRNRRWLISLFAWLCALAAGALSGHWIPLLCCLVIAALALVDTDTEYVPPHTYGLKGVPDGIPPVLKAPEQLHWASAPLGAALIVVLSAFDVPVLISIAVTLVVGLITWLRAAPWLVGRAHLRKIRRALKAHNPTTMMGYAGRSGGPWQLKMWEPFIVASGENNIVINVHAKYLPMIVDGADLSSPLIQLGSRELAELDDLIPASVKAGFYVQNARTNKEFWKFDQITHVWLNHGDSDKPANFNPRHALYDVLVVCGQAGIDRYAKHGIEIPDSKFVVLGRPQSKGIDVTDQPIGDLENKKVLYAPTWQGLSDDVNFSSLEAGPAIVRGLLNRGATVYFRPHPLSYRWARRRAVIKRIREMLSDDAAAHSREHRFGEHVDKTMSIADLTNECDALVSDVSSVVSDFLASGKPYAMTSMRGPVEEFVKEFSVAETAYVIAGDMSNLDDALDDLLFDDPLALARQERRRYVLGELDGEQSAEAFADFVRNLVGAS